MVSNDLSALRKALELLQREKESLNSIDEEESLHCPQCEKGPFSSAPVFASHLPFFHSNERCQYAGPCPVCQIDLSTLHKGGSRGRLAKHLALTHASPPLIVDSGPAPPLYAFSLVIVRHPQTHRYLLVHECAQQGYWLPGGRVEAWETFQEGARRECLEEAGVRIRLTGILNVAFTPALAMNPQSSQGGVASRFLPSWARQTIVFLAEPEGLNDCTPKSLPDYESAGASWVDAAEIPQLNLRAREPLTWINNYMEKGGQVFDLSLLS